MNGVIDERIVQMKFDNKQFQQATADTMSTLEKLKQKLNFTGASKGLENVNTAVRNVNMQGLSTAVHQVHLKFSALEVMGVTALANITNSAVNAGKRMMSALTIDPIKTGFQEYETQINSVQTILANTSSKGSTIEDVNKALAELNGYADMTIYNFTEMTRNIGTFTAAGIDLDTSVNAIQGIANLAAVSGSTSQQASTAMYQLSQALAAGTVKLMDWNSVVNAGMGGEVFQTALKETSALLGTGAEAAIKASGSFRESLSDGWLTAEVLTETLKKFTLSGANEYVAKYTGLTLDAVEAELKAVEAMEDQEAAIDKVADSLAKKSGKNKDEIKDALQMARTATDAATKVKTFTQLWDVMKETAQSGWTQTWNLLIGDFEEAKALLTPLADFFTGVIGKMSDFRNKILENALVRNFKAIGASMEDMLYPVTIWTQSADRVGNALKEIGDLANEVMQGLWGIGDDRVDKLTEAGYNWAEVQNKVNEKMGSSVRHSTDLAKVQNDLAESQEKAAEATSKLTEEDKEHLAFLARLSDRNLKAREFTDEQIESLRELKKTSDQLGMSVEEFLHNIDQINGRWLMIESFKNVGASLARIFKTIGAAWRTIFYGDDDPIERHSQQLFNLLAGLYKFTRQLRISEDSVNKLYSTFKGVFAALDIAMTVIGGPLSLAFKLLMQLLGAFDLHILDITSVIGDAIVKFRDWIDSILDFTAIFEEMAPVVRRNALAVKYWVDDNIDLVKGFKSVCGVLNKATKSFKKWVDGLEKAEDLPKAIADGIVNGFKLIPKYLKMIRDALKETFTGDFEFSFDSMFNKLPNSVKIAGEVIKELGVMLLDSINSVLSKYGFEEISIDMISGLVNGIKGEASRVWNAMVELGSQLIEKIKGVLGIHSPSTVFYTIGGFIIAGLVAGLLAGNGSVFDAVRGLGERIAETFSEIDFKTVFSAVISAGLLKALLDVTSAMRGAGKMLEGMGSVFEGAGEVLENTAGVMEALQKTVKSFSAGIKAKALKDVAIALLILVGAIAVLTFLDPGKVWAAIGALIALAIVLGGLFFAMNKIGGTNDPKDFKNGIVNVVKIGSLLLSMSVSLLIIAATLKILESIDPDNAVMAFGGLVAIVLAIRGVFAAYGKLIVGKQAFANIAKVGSVLLLMSASFLIMAMVVKRLGKMDPAVLVQGTVTIGLFAGLMTGMIAMSKLAGKKVDNIGKTIFMMSLALLSMATAVRILGKMDPDVLGQGIVAITLFAGIMTGMVAMTRLAGGDKLDELSKVLAGMSSVMLVMAVVVKILGGMEPEALVQGTLAVAAFAGIIAGLVATTKLATDKELKGLAGTLISMAIAIGVMGAVSILLGLIKTEYLVKGVTAVGILAGLVTAMVWATKGANDAKGNLIAMTVAIGIMAVAIAALSFIDPTKLASAVAAMGSLMLAFTLMIKVGGQAKGSMSTLIIMTVAIGLMGGLLFLLSKLPVENCVGNAVALSVLLLAVSGAMAILSEMAIKLDNVIEAAFGLLFIAVPMLAFVGILALMSKISNATENAKTLCNLMLAMTLVLGALTIIGAFGLSALAGVVLLTLMAVPMLLVVNILKKMSGIEDATENTDSLVKLMGALTIMLAVLAIVGPFALAGISAMAALVGLIVAIGVLAVGIGALMDKFPQIEEFLDTGIPILERLAYTVGSMIGNIFAGMVDATSASLPRLGKALSDFMTNATPFVEGIKMVDSSVLDGTKALAASVLALSGADFYKGLMSFLQGGSSFADLGTDLADFATNAMPFLTNANLINEQAMSGVTAIADMILALTQSGLNEGLAAWFNGESSLVKFGSQLPQLGTDISTFVGNLGAFDESTVTTVKSAANCITALANAGEKIDGQSEWAAKLFGDDSLAAFGDQLPGLGTNLSTFATNLGTFDEATVATIKCAADVIKVLANAASNIPNEGGMWAAIFGDNSLSAFGSELPQLGTDLAGFASNLGTFDDATVATVKCAAESIGEMAKAAEGIDGQSEWAAKLFGDNGLDKFGEKLPDLGEGLAGFVENLGTFSDAQVATVKQATGAIKSFAALADSNLIGANQQLESFSEKMPNIGTKISEFCENLPGADTIESAVSGFKKVLDVIQDVDKDVAQTAEDFANSLGEIGTDAVDKFTDAFTSKSAKTDVESAVTDMTDDAAEAAEDNIDGFEDAGKNAAIGFADGIDENTYKAEAKARAMAKAALKAAEEALDENSPSKETFRIGKFFVLGFSNAVTKFTGVASSAGANMAEKTKVSFGNALSKIKMGFDPDMDLQPTIRPVVDMSEVKTGANAIRGMFNGQSIAVAANVRSVSTAMNRRAQATTNDDVVAGLDRLGKKLDNVGGNSYNINGVNYTESSDVSDAIKVIVRAATMERRK